MSRYRRAIAPGGTFFFTVNLSNRRSGLLTDHIDLLRAAYGKVAQELPFHTVAVCVLPDHLHAVWTLPPADGDFSVRWQRIKAHFSQPLPAQAGRSDSKCVNGKKAFGSGAFGNTKSATMLICKGMWITFITIR